MNWPKPSRPSCFAYAGIFWLIGVLVSCSQPRDVLVPEVMMLTAEPLNEFRAVQHRLRKKECTPRAYVAGPETVLSFPLDQAPVSSEFECEIQVLSDEPGEGETLRVELQGFFQQEPHGDWSKVVSLSREEGQSWSKVRIPIESKERLSELTMRVRLDSNEEAASVGILRPRLRFHRSIQMKKEDQPRRQIVLMTLDTLRADVLGCYGNREVQTPAFDRLAAKSTVFTRAFSTTNVTNSSHVSIFTSLHLKDHGVVNNRTKLEPTTRTMIEEVSQQGLTTAGFVAAYLFEGSRSSLSGRFDEFYGCEVVSQRRAEDVNGDLLPWLNEHANEDFFVWVHYFDPHMPYDAPYPFNRMYRSDSTGEKIERQLNYGGNLDWFAESDDAQYYRNQYHGEVSYLDQQVGELLDHLEALSILDGALIGVVADHGESLGEHGIYCGHGGLYDSTTRVPLMVKLPGQQRGGAFDGLVSSMDLYPSIAEAFDFEAPPPIRGRSLLSVMKAVGFSGEVPPSDGFDSVVSEYAGLSQVTVRTPDHRFLLALKDRELYPRFGLEKDKIELYDLTKDPGQLRDISGLEVDLVRGFEEQVRQFLADRIRSSAREVLGEEDRKKLLELGYTEDGE